MIDIKIKKLLKKGIIYPNEMATLILDKNKTAKKTVISVNDFFNKDVIVYNEVKSVFKDISKNQENIENPEVGVRQKQETALKSMVASAINKGVADSLPAKTLCIWIASSSDNPSLEHVENYGQEFYLEDGINGELPGDRPNCQCGYLIKNIPNNESNDIGLNSATKSTINKNI